MPKYEPYKLIGLKFYRFEDDKETPNIVRLLKYDELKKVYFCIDCNTGDKIDIGYEELHTKWIKLNPDGIIAFSNCTAIDNQGESVPDVMVRVHKMLETGVIDPTPYAVCRQAVIDIFILLQSANTRYVAGMTMSKDTCPPELNYDCIYSFEKITYNINVAYYLDDHLDDILALFNNKKFNEHLALIKSRDKMGIEGYCTTLHDLLKENFFMMDVHRGFDIHELAFESFDFADDNTNRVVTDYIISNLQEVPIKFYPVKYSKYIDLKDIKRKYILICPSSYMYPNGDIVILGYDISPTISFKDMVNKGKSPKSAKREIMSNLGWA